jgi:hypothetical protein
MRIMIYVAITAVGTLLINATTTGPIVRRLGLTAIPKVELKLDPNTQEPNPILTPTLVLTPTPTPTPTPPGNPNSRWR